MIYSGRLGYEFAEINDVQVNISRDTLISMLKYENKLRLSEEWISKMEDECINNIDSPLNGYMTGNISPTINKLQIEVVKKFGYKLSSEIDEALKILRSAMSIYPNDQEIKNSANYLKYNKIDKGIFKIGDKMNIDGINMVCIDKDKNQQKCDEEEKKMDINNNDIKMIKLEQLLSKQNINVIMAVSIS